MDLIIEKNDIVLNCPICPNECLLKPGQLGKCKSMKKVQRGIADLYSDFISSSNIDPIEKKPLYHFYPGSEIFSIGFYGCTMSCKFCQNYSISQISQVEEKRSSSKEDIKRTPLEVFNILRQSGYKMVAVTYSEPLLHFPWVLELFKLCKEYGIKTVLVTNGYTTIENSIKLFPYVDAMNVDLKSSSDSFYNKICGAKLEPVKEFIKEGYKAGVHMEITTLVITEANDSLFECDEITDFIASTSKDIPFHISRYFPTYKMENVATSVDTIKNWVSLASKKLNYVYGGNIDVSSDTICPHCGAILIKREQHSAKNVNIEKYDTDIKCKKCQTSLASFVM